MTILKRIYRPMFEIKTYNEVLFLLSGLFFGVLWFTVFITLYSVGIGTVIVWVGVPILVGAQALLRSVGAIERAQVQRLLGRQVPTPAPLDFEPAPPSEHSRWVNLGRRSHALMHDGHSWRVFAWTCLRIVLGPVGFSFAVVYLSVPPSLILAPLWDIFDWNLNDGYHWTGWMWFGPLAFFIITPALAWVIRGLGDLSLIHI